MKLPRNTIPIVCILCAAAIACYGYEGWIWFLVVALLTYDESKQGGQP